MAADGGDETPAFTIRPVIFGLLYLSTVDPDLDRTNVKTGSNTFNPEWDSLEGIEEWDDFIYENLIAMLDDVLTRPYQSHELETPAQIRRITRCIIDEPTVTAVLLKWNHTIVDCALKLAAEAFTDIVSSISWTLSAHASFSEETVFPDWAGIDTISLLTSNRVPGDSKVSDKWCIDQHHEERELIRDFAQSHNMVDVTSWQASLYKRECGSKKEGSKS
ncbi:hypothetical protein FQN54_004888 [Arachnomyces sp. PD_36]|nr:hypothetical protein FQN54_004888 [Arachnomyces sp. PD_36]